MEEFKVSTDPFLITRSHVVGLYLAPPSNAAVFSVDEKPQIQALERTAPVLPMAPAPRSGAATTTNGTAPGRSPR